MGVKLNLYGRRFPAWDMVAFWNCSSYLCDTERGVPLSVHHRLEAKGFLDVPGIPSFLGWSDNQDRLLYYLGQPWRRLLSG